MTLPQTVAFTRNDEGRALVNIERPCVHHSPDGFEWGYPGSGPSDLALNLLELLVLDLRTQLSPDTCEAWGLNETVELYRGRCTRFAWRHHHALKEELVAPLPLEGGTISKGELIVWSLKRGALEVATREAGFEVAPV